MCAATRFASSEPSSHGYSCFSMYEHVGPGTTISQPIAHRLGQAPGIVGDESLGLLHGAAVEIGHPAAPLRRQRHVHAVLLEHGDRRLAGAGIVVLDRAGREEGDALFDAAANRFARRRSNQRENVSRWNAGSFAVPVDPDRRLHQAAVDLEARDPVRQGRRRAPELADQLGVAEKAILQRHALLPGRRGPRAQHEAREIDLPPVRRRVRAMVVAELALIAEVDDFLDVGGRQLLDVAVHGIRVEPVEHHLERRAQRQAAPAARADVVDAAQLRVHLVELPEIRLPNVECHRVGRPERRLRGRNVLRDGGGRRGPLPML